MTTERYIDYFEWCLENKKPPYSDKTAELFIEQLKKYDMEDKKNEY